MHPSQHPHYWNERYLHHNTPWDIGQVSPALKAYMDAQLDPDDRILIPGAGNAHEAVYLHQRGFKRVYICDWAPEAFHYLESELPDFPQDHKLIADFFTLEDQFDILIEQTFFCALPPPIRSQYVRQVHNLLRPGGWLVGLLFNREFPFEGPPFGGTKEEYLSLFESHFEVHEMRTTPWSIKPRLGNELFIRLQKPI